MFESEFTVREGGEMRVIDGHFGGLGVLQINLSTHAHRVSIQSKILWDLSKTWIFKSLLQPSYELKVKNLVILELAKIHPNGFDKKKILHFEELYNLHKIKTMAIFKSAYVQLGKAKED
jgi:hypothetical protein